MSDVISKSEALDNISANISACLDKTGMPQGDIARRIKEPKEDLQAARMRVYRYKNGLAMPDAVALARVAEALGVTTDFLLSKPQPPNPPKKRRRAG